MSYLWVNFVCCIFSAPKIHFLFVHYFLYAIYVYFAVRNYCCRDFGIRFAAASVRVFCVHDGARPQRWLFFHFKAIIIFSAVDDTGE